jgi:hypothetical protein
MRGDGVFSHSDPEMMRFLATIGTDRSHPKAFVARNFLLDEGVLRERYESYADAGAVADHGTGEAWNAAHERYLVEHVFRPGTGYIPTRTVDPTDLDACPETFRYIDDHSPFYRSDPGLDLLRVEQLGFIARESGQTAQRVKELAHLVIDSRHSTLIPAYRELADILETWTLQTDARPVFAGYWEDMRDLFGPTPAQDTSDWADQLRDRLGLLHLNPGSRTQPSIDVIVFRYPVRSLPRLLKTFLDPNSRPLVPPTVLDGHHSIAFCPAPRGQLTGYTIDLGQNSPPARQEVVHPRTLFKPENVWRVGEIRRTMAEDELSEARRWHLEVVRDRAGRDDYAAQTDEDLLGS